ncbi:MAG: outer-membrane lipoprotein carrier protein LolA [Pseudomonadales bacterium]
MFVIWAAATGGAVHALDAGNSPGAAALASLLAGKQSYYANFSQQLRDSEGQLVDESSGWMAWQRPASFRWEINAPLAQTLLVKGEIYYQYDRDLEQMLVQPLSDDVAMLPRLLLEGDASAIAARYQVEAVVALPVTDGASARGAAPQLFRLQPRGEAGLFSELLLEFRGENLQAINITDDMQQNSRFEFSKQSGEVEANFFDVEPAPGTEIIHQ